MTSLSLGLGIAAASPPAWFSHPAYTAIAEATGLSSGPSFVADFHRRRFAVTRIEAQAIPSSTPAGLSRLSSCRFTDLFSYSRPSAASYVDASGRLQLAAADEPRFDWATGTGALLLERPSTNMLLYSQTLSAASWIKSSSLLTGQTIISGSLALEGVRRSGEVFGGLQQPVSIVDGTQYTFSVFLSRQDGGISWFGLYNNTDALWQTTVQVTWPAAHVSLAAAHISIPPNGQRNPPTDIRIQPLTGGIYRLSFTFVPTSATGDFVSVNAQANRAADMTSNYFGGFQLEPSPFATSYMPTGNTAATRAADRCRLSPAAEALLQRDEASVLVQAESLSGAGGRLLGAAGNTGLLSISGDGTGLAVGTEAPLPIGTDLASPLPALGSAFAFGASGKAGCHNGASVASHAFPIDAARVPAYLGRDGDGNFAGGRYRALVLWPFRMTEVSLQAKAVYDVL